MRNKKILTTLLTTSSLSMLISPLMNFGLVSCTKATKPATKNTYVVHFDTGYGSTISDQKVIDGNLLNKPSDPKLDYHKFVWWYTDPECTDGTEFRFSKPITSNLTLYAKWELHIIDVTAIEINHLSETIYPGRTYQLTANVFPKKASFKKISWTSSDESIAKIDEDSGLLTPIAPGQVTITATSPIYSSISDTYSFNVTEFVQVTDIKISSERSVLQNGTIRLLPVVYPLNASDKTLTWSSDNPEIASVDNDGNVKGLTLGTTNIHVKSVSNPSVTATCKLEVVDKIIDVSRIKLNKTDIKFVTPSSGQLTATIYPENATDKSVIWWSDDKSIANVDQSGLVTGITNGDTIIHVQSVSTPKVTAECNVKVNIGIESVSLPATAYTDVTTTLQLTATVLPEDAYDKRVTWSSSDEKIATVDESGLIQPHAVGSVNITATSVYDPTKFATCSVAIYPILIDNAINIIGTEKFDFGIYKKLWNGKIEYSLDSTNWKEWNGEKIYDIYTIYLRGKGNNYLSLDDVNNVGSFIFSTKSSFSNDLKIFAHGNINCLLDYEDPDNAQLGPYAFCSLFSNCRWLVSPPTLPATRLSNYCYEGMFNACTNLLSAPELPAPALTSNCYKYMFTDCKSLKTPPKLPATFLANSCYNYMFKGCTSLTSTPKLLADTLSPYCYFHMFQLCTSLTITPELPATNLADYCYASMFNGCTSLYECTALPATVLPDSCYSSMFAGCTKLARLKPMSAKEFGNHCCFEMFYGCSKVDIDTIRQDESAYVYFITPSDATEDDNRFKNMFYQTRRGSIAIKGDTKYWYWNRRTK